MYHVSGVSSTVALRLKDKKGNKNKTISGSARTLCHLLSLCDELLHGQATSKSEINALVTKIILRSDLITING